MKWVELRIPVSGAIIINYSCPGCGNFVINPSTITIIKELLESFDERKKEFREGGLLS